MVENTSNNANDNLIQRPGELPFCYPNSQQDCYKMFSSIIKTQNDQTKTLDDISTALLGSKYSIEGGMVNEVKKQAGDIKLLKGVYAILAAILIVGGTLLTIFSKLGIKLVSYFQNFQ